MNKKWTIENIKLEAKKYIKKSDFFKYSGSAYNKARTLGILEEVCSHMPEASNSVWSTKELEAEALKYKTRGEFQKKSRNAYKSAYSRGILDMICQHMSYTIHPWTDEELRLEALKYNSRSEFKNSSQKAYSVASKRKIIDSVCSHMTRLVREDWTYEELKYEALKYKTKWEFQQINLGAYRAAHKRKILDSICSHMISGTNISVPEKDLFDIIKTIYPKTQKLVDRKGKIKGKPHIQGFDLDIYVPELRKGIEFDGKYYHSFNGLKRGRPNWPDEDIKIYHELKDRWFKSKNIKILHIKEKDWLENKQSCVDECLRFLKKY